jgi:hypothetical protein
MLVDIQAPEVSHLESEIGILAVVNGSRDTAIAHIIGVLGCPGTIHLSLNSYPWIMYGA